MNRMDAGQKDEETDLGATHPRNHASQSLKPRTEVRNDARFLSHGELHMSLLLKTCFGIEFTPFRKQCPDRIKCGFSRFVLTHLVEEIDDDAVFPASFSRTLWRKLMTAQSSLRRTRSKVEPASFGFSLP